MVLVWEYPGNLALSKSNNEISMYSGEILLNSYKNKNKKLEINTLIGILC